MIAELGQFALILAFATALYQTTVPLYGAWRGDQRLMAVAPPAAMLQVCLIAVAFGCLTWAYVTSDFSVENVYMNSHSDKPLIYKISGVWGNHEGSMVLWVLILRHFRLCRGDIRRQPAAQPESPRHRRSGLDLSGFPAVHPAHLQSVQPA